MGNDMFEMDVGLARRITVKEDWQISISEGGDPSRKIRLEECPKVVLNGRAYAITGPLEEMTLKPAKIPKVVRHYWNVLSVDLDYPPEADGRLVCKRMLCERVGQSLWRVTDETVTCYTDADDRKEFGSHPVFNPETGEIERSTAACDFL